MCLPFLPLRLGTADDRVRAQLRCENVQGDKVKPADVLKPYEAVDRLKRAYVQVNSTPSTKSLNG